MSELEKGWEILMYKDMPIPTTFTADKVGRASLGRIQGLSGECRSLSLSPKP